jgi:hypothetical protein
MSLCAAVETEWPFKIRALQLRLTPIRENTIVSCNIVVYQPLRATFAGSDFQRLRALNACHTCETM